MGKFFLASLGSCIRLCRFDPFARKVYCKTSADSSVFSDQDFYIALHVYSHSSQFISSLTFPSLLHQNFFPHNDNFLKDAISKTLGSCLLFLCTGNTEFIP